MLPVHRLFFTSLIIWNTPLKNAVLKSALVPVRPMHTVADVAARLTVRRAIEDGELHVHQIGRQHRIAEDDLLAFIAQKRK